MPFWTWICRGFSSISHDVIVLTGSFGGPCRKHHRQPWTKHTTLLDVFRPISPYTPAGKMAENRNNRFYVKISLLNHCGRATHICVSKLTIIGSDNGLSLERRQAITWTNAGILLIGPLGTNFSEIVIEIQTFSLKKMHLKMSSAKWRPFCLGLNVLTVLWLGQQSLGNVIIISKSVFNLNTVKPVCNDHL